MKKLIIFIMIVCVSLQFQGCKKNDDSTEESTYGVEHPDADKYYEENSQIISEIKAKKSKNVNTEEEVITILRERGFDQYPVESEYLLDGEYYDSESVSEDSDEKHPIYETYYVNEKEEIWIITVINGEIMANPVSYNLQSEKEVETVISETETIMSYDSTTNKFYETIPDTSVLEVIVIDNINADILDTLTIGEID